MITRTEALALRAQLIQGLPDRFEAGIRAAFRNGATTFTFSYEPASDTQANNFISNTMNPAGWTGNISIDTVAKTITVQ
jgi:hypothetical protein